MNPKLLFGSRRAVVITIILVTLGCIGLAAEKTPTAKQKAARKKAPADGDAVLASPLGNRWELTDATLHRDFPVLAIDANGAAWIAFIEHDGKADVLKLARKTAQGLETIATLSEPG